MKRRPFLLLLFFVTACGSTPQAVATPSNEIGLSPPPTSTTIPIPTSLPITPTSGYEISVPEPMANPSLFRDEFEGTLNPQWNWVREDPLNWSLVTIPGSLQINVEGGYVPAHANSNLLLRSAPKENFEIETKITFRPTDNSQFAGLIIYQSDSNFVEAGRQFCTAAGCIGDGLYMDTYRRGFAVKPSVGHSYTKSDLILLRLSRRENSYTFEASTDGKVWFNIGSLTSDVNPLQIGLVAGQTQEGKFLSAVFDYFEVRSLP